MMGWMLVDLFNVIRLSFNCEPLVSDSNSLFYGPRFVLTWRVAQCCLSPIVNLPPSHPSVSLFHCCSYFGSSTNKPESSRLFDQPIKCAKQAVNGGQVID